MRQLIYTMLVSNNQASFQLWWKERLVKHQKVSKYYDNDCSVFMMGMNKTQRCFHIVETWICKDSVRLTRPRKCEVILGVNFFSIKPFLKELSFFWVAGFFLWSANWIIKYLYICLSLGLCWIWMSNDWCIRGTRNDSCWKLSYTVIAEHDVESKKKKELQPERM